MNISVVNPLSPALSRTTGMLFKPFDIGRWFKLGFCVWVAFLGEGGCRFNFNSSSQRSSSGGPGFGGSSDGGPQSKPNAAVQLEQQLREWFNENLLLLVGIFLIIVLVFAMIMIAIKWLNSRFRFIFIDNLVHDRALIQRPWAEYRQEGHSHFLFRAAMFVAVLVISLLLVAVAAAIGYSDIRSGTFTSAGAIALAVFVFGAVAMAIANYVVMFLFDRFVTPVMYLRHVRARQAWRIFHDEMLTERVGLFLLYWLFNIVIGICTAMTALVVTLILCCIPLIPYLGTVILLPIFVFNQAYSLYFIEQFGEKWRIFPTPPPTAMPYPGPYGAPTGYYPPPNYPPAGYPAAGYPLSDSPPPGNPWTDMS